MTTTIYIIVKQMETIKFKDNKVTAEIPKPLYQAIIRIQGEKDVDFPEACEIAGELVDPRRKDFEKAVKVEVDRRVKSKFMIQVNKAKETISEKKYLEGHYEGVEVGLNSYRYPCNICGKPIPLNEKTWEYASQFLTKLGWGHSSCHKQNY